MSAAAEIDRLRQARCDRWAEAKARGISLFAFTDMERQRLREQGEHDARAGLPAQTQVVPMTDADADAYREGYKRGGGEC